MKEAWIGATRRLSMSTARGCAVGDVERPPSAATAHPARRRRPGPRKNLEIAAGEDLPDAGVHASSTKMVPSGVSVRSSKCGSPSSGGTCRWRRRRHRCRNLEDRRGLRSFLEALPSRGRPRRRPRGSPLDRSARRGAPAVAPGRNESVIRPRGTIAPSAADAQTKKLLVMGSYATPSATTSFLRDGPGRVVVGLLGKRAHAATTRCTLAAYGPSPCRGLRRCVAREDLLPACGNGRFAPTVQAVRHAEVVERGTSSGRSASS